MAGSCTFHTTRSKFWGIKMNYVFGELLRGFRQREGFSRVELAEILGVSANTIGNWERSNYLPRKIEVVIQIGDAFSLPYEEKKQLFHASGLLPNHNGAEYSAITQRSKKPLQIPHQIIHFTNRTQALKKLKSDLKPGAVITLCGPGGIGKTALASEVLHTLYRENLLQEKFPDGILFYSFYNSPLSTLALEHFVRSLGQTDLRPTAVAAARRALAGKLALLVLDGAEEADNLDKVLEVRGLCGVLITSRKLSDALADRRDIQPLEQTETITLLQKWGGEHAQDHETCKRIFVHIGGLPLAARLIGHYVSTQKEPISTYLGWLKESPFIALNHGTHQSKNIALLLEKSLKCLSQSAVDVLTIVGALANEQFSSGISAHILDKSSKSIYLCFSELINYGFLTKQNDKYQIIHPLIHTFARESLTLSRPLLSNLAQYFQDLFRQETAVKEFDKFDADRSHSLSVIDLCMKRGAWREVIQLADSMDYYLDTGGYWVHHLDVLLKQLDAAKKIKAQADVLRVTTQLGYLYKKMGELDKSFDYCEKAIQLNMIEGSTTAQIDLMFQLAAIYLDRGRYEDAEHIARKIINLSQTHGYGFGEARGYGSLAAVKRHYNLQEEAIGYYKRATELCYQVKNYGNVSVYMLLQAYTYYELEDYDAALMCIDEALRIEEIKQPKLQMGLLDIQGLIYWKRDELFEAIRSFEAALIISRKLNARIRESEYLEHLGDVYHTLEDYNKSKSYYSQSYLLTEVLGLESAARLKNKFFLIVTAQNAN